jgi:hypothetical protein
VRDFALARLGGCACDARDGDGGAGGDDAARMAPDGEATTNKEKISLGTGSASSAHPTFSRQAAIDDGCLVTCRWKAGAALPFFPL